MKRLNGARELLDGELNVQTLEGNLRDLSRVNSWLGGAGVSYRALERLNPGALKRLSVLDVGTGGADIPVRLIEMAKYGGPRLDITATDVRPEIVAAAQRTVAGLPITVKVSPADRIDEDNDSFDVVHSSMVLHHVEPEAAVALLREMARVARRAVIVNDLDRGRLWWFYARVLSTLATRNPYTRNDAPLSVRRAYRPNEIVAMAQKSGLVQEARDWTWPRYRYAITLRHDGHRRG